MPAQTPLIEEMEPFEPRDEAYINQICTIFQEAIESSRLLGYCGPFIFLSHNPELCFRYGRPLERNEDGTLVVCIRNYIVQHILFRRYNTLPSPEEQLLIDAIYQLLGFHYINVNALQQAGQFLLLYNNE